jgi:hypothetical protein
MSHHPLWSIQLYIYGTFIITNLLYLSSRILSSRLKCTFIVSQSTAYNRLWCFTSLTCVFNDCLCFSWTTDVVFLNDDVELDSSWTTGGPLQLSKLFCQVLKSPWRDSWLFCLLPFFFLKAMYQHHRHVMSLIRK